jgi:hypothetical protein
MARSSLYIAPNALDKVINVHCRVGLSIIELDHWWIELWQDYGVVLVAGNDNAAAA